MFASLRPWLFARAGRNPRDREAKTYRHVTGSKLLAGCVPLYGWASKQLGEVKAPQASLDLENRAFWLNLSRFQARRSLTSLRLAAWPKYTSEASALAPPSAALKG